MLAAIRQSEGETVAVQLILLKAFRPDKKRQGIGIPGTGTAIGPLVVMLWQVLNLVKELLDRVGIRERPDTDGCLIVTHLIQTRHAQAGGFRAGVSGATC